MAYGIAVNDHRAALRDGALLVVLIVFAFLVSVRATRITLLAIPLSLVTAVPAMSALGATINAMPLGGMAIVFATLIITLAVLPLFFLYGVVGERLLAPLGFALVVLLAASLLVAVTGTPVLSSLWLPGSKVVNNAQESFIALSLKALYGPVLNATVPRWKAVTLTAATGLVVALAFLLSAGRSFLPDFNEGSLTVSAVTLPGIALEESDRRGRMVEDILLLHPEVKLTARRTDRAEQDPHAQDVHSSERAGGEL